MSLKSILISAALGLAGIAFAGAPARAADTKKAEKKCDTAGKECKDGKDCKAENCKQAEPKADVPEKKCDTKGKECKDGKDCKAENCKKEAPKL